MIHTKIIGSDIEYDLFGLISIQLSMMHAPQYILDPIPSKSQINGLHRLPNPVPGFDPSVNTGFGLATPEMSNRVTDQYHTGRITTNGFQNRFMSGHKIISSMIPALTNGLRSNHIAFLFMKNTSYDLFIGLCVLHHPDIVRMRTVNRTL